MKRITPKSTVIRCWRMDKAVDQEFWEIVRQAAPEATVNGWVLLIEVRDSDKPRLLLKTSDLMTPWTAEGMLNYGLEMVAQIEEDYAEDEEE